MTTLQLLKTPLIEKGVPELERLTGLYSQIKDAIITLRLRADHAYATQWVSEYNKIRSDVEELEFKLETCRILLTKFNS